MQLFIRNILFILSYHLFIDTQLEQWVTFEQIHTIYNNWGHGTPFTPSIVC